MSLVHLVLGTLLSPTPLPVRRRRDERGLSQSTEQALLLGGARVRTHPLHAGFVRAPPGG